MGKTFKDKKQIKSYKKKQGDLFDNKISKKNKLNERRKHKYIEYSDDDST
jgi:hypothetical protein